MRRAASLAAAAGMLAGCQGSQSVLAPFGRQALALADLIWLIIGVAVVIWLLVVLVLLVALSRHAGAAPSSADEGRMGRVVTGAVVMTAIVIAGLTAASYRTTRTIGEPRGETLSITVNGQQWWWQVRYEGALGFETANEIHIPVGRDVRLTLQSPDVIHSFWVPSLAGKLDLVPGRSNVLTLHALRPGTYRGQCAEYCGLQHSHMALEVIAESEADFSRWQAAQRADAPAPPAGDAAAGAKVFLQKPCAACHRVRGTPAQGQTGPDLTHVGSRRLIAAGLLENSRGAMAAWIADPQTLKPGNNMPLVPLTGEELRQVSAYLESLK